MFNIAGKIFEEELTKLINNSGLTISEAYYIVENASLKLKLLLTEMIMEEQMHPQSFIEQKTAEIKIDESQRFVDIEENNEEVSE